MRILLIGDIIGKPGRYALQKLLPGIRREYRVDLVVANGENGVLEQFELNGVFYFCHFPYSSANVLRILPGQRRSVQSQCRVDWPYEQTEQTDNIIRKHADRGLRAVLPGHCERRLGPCGH